MLLAFIILFFIIAIITLKLKLFIQVKNSYKDIKLKFYIFNRIQIGKVDLNKTNRNFGKKFNSSVQNKLKKIDIGGLVSDSLKKSNIQLECIKLRADICTTDAVLTSYLVAVVSSAIALLIRLSKAKIDYKNFFYKINPVYTDKKILNIRLKCIISINFVHIIITIARRIKEWRRDKDGRKPPNRAAYGNRNEQHKTNDRCKYNNRRAHKGSE